MSVKLAVKTREDLSNNKLRKSGTIPAVYYHKHEESESIQVTQKDLVHVLHSHERIVELSNGKLAVIKELQKDPVSNKILHVSFEGVVKGEKFTATIPLEVVYEGKPSWMQEDYVVRQLEKSIEVKTTPGKLPEKLVLDVTKCSKDDTLTIKDLKLEKGLEVSDDSVELVTFAHEKVQEEVEEVESNEGEETPVETTADATDEKSE